MGELIAFLLGIVVGVVIMFVGSIPVILQNAHRWDEIQMLKRRTGHG